MLLFSPLALQTSQLCLVLSTHLLKVGRLRAQCDVVPCTIRDASIMLALRRATGEGARLIIKGLGAQRPLEADFKRLVNLEMIRKKLSKPTNWITISI